MCHLPSWAINGGGRDEAEEGYRRYIIKALLDKAKEFGFSSKMKNF